MGLWLPHVHRDLRLPEPPVLWSLELGPPGAFSGCRDGGGGSASFLPPPLLLASSPFVGPPFSYRYSARL